MNFFPSRQSRRRTAFAVLAMWLFALGTGWANACLLQQRGTHAHVQTEIAAPADSAIVVSAGHVGVDSAHDDAGVGAGSKACQKVCDDESQTVVKLPSVFDLADVAMAPPVATLWAAFAPLPEAGVRAHEASAPSAGPPLRTRYSRLAL